MLKRFMANNGFLPMYAADGGGAGGGAGEGEGNTGAGAGAGAGEESGAAGSASSDNGGSGSKETKTFTQEEVNRLLAKEKESGRRSVLKEILGTEDVKTAKDGWNKYQQHLESQKTEQQKKDEALAKEQKARADAEARERAANNKLALMAAGAKKEAMDDLLVLANAKVNETTTIDIVIADLKKVHGSMFDGEGSEGTGTSGNPQKKKVPDKLEGLGKRLAERSAAAQPAKNPFFTE